MIKILELFGGIGAPRKALINLGVNIKAIDYVEIDEKAVKSYNALFDNDYGIQDVRGYNLRPDILIHGSPCQSFSIAGKQAGADEGSGTESSLMWETINIIKQMGTWKPRVIVWENVKNVLSKHMVHNFNRYLTEMEKLGYKNSFEILNSMDFGLPQNRNRVFTVSRLDKEFDFRKMKKCKLRDINEFIEKEVDDSYIVTQPSILRAIGKKGIIARAPIINDFCYTITERQDRLPNAGLVYLGNDIYRFLSERECWRLQGFDDEDFEKVSKVNSRRALYKQAGNTIPVTILESLFDALL